MAQYEAKLRSLARDAAPPPLRVPGRDREQDTATDEEAEEAAIIAARLGGVDQFD